MPNWVAVNAKHRTEKIKERVLTQLNKKKLQVNKTKQRNIQSKEIDKQIGNDINIWEAY